MLAIWEKLRGPTIRAALVIAGVVLVQAILFWPSLSGQKVLLPLDLLKLPGDLIPSAQGEKPAFHNWVRSDLSRTCEPERRCDAEELLAGRWPMWRTFCFGGTPNITPRMSPFWLLAISTTSPAILSWVQLLTALVAGTGAYVFCRRVLQVGFPPALIAAWCYPLTGFFVFWQGYFLPYNLAWLPWLLLAVDKTVRAARPWAGAALGGTTFLVVVSGQLDGAGQVLLTSGLYAVWCWFDQYIKPWLAERFGTQPSQRRRRRQQADAIVSVPQPTTLPILGPALRGGVALAAGWGLGFLLAAPYILPLMEYTRTGARMARRSEGSEERPPVGLPALPEIVLPDMYGTTQLGSFYLNVPGQGNQLESSAAAYAGLLATLFLAPLAWCSRRHRSLNVFWLILIVLSLAWVLDIPGLVSLLRLRGLNMFSHNRWVFAASFAIVAMMAEGLEALSQGTPQRRAWFWGPAILAAGVFAYCALRTLSPPELTVHTSNGSTISLETIVRRGGSLAMQSIATLDDVRAVRRSFVLYFACSTLLAGLAAGGWIALFRQIKPRPWFVPLLGFLVTADLLCFAYNRSAQCDWSLNYPQNPVLRQVAEAKPPGRIMPVDWLSATLAQTQGLRDVRGYDAVDPTRFVELLTLAGNPKSLGPAYAATEFLAPQFIRQPNGDVRVHPILDMLNVRYVPVRGSPPPEIHPEFAGDDCWVWTNRRALPRAFVPESVETIADDKRRLAAMASISFDPRQVAYVETPLDLPAICRGTAEIVDEIPSRVTIAVDMQTRGLVVLADLWDKGWNAYLDGKPLPILRANHALRGVEVPVGQATLEFRYEPASFAWGLRLAAIGLAVCVAWFAVGLWRRRVGAADAPPTPPLQPEVAPAAKQSSPKRPSKRR